MNHRTKVDPYLPRNVSWYRNVSETGPGIELSIENLFEKIRHDVSIKELSEFIRAAPDWNQTNPKTAKGQPKQYTEYNRLKLSAEGVLISGTFRAKAEESSVIEPSGLIGLDLDHLNERVAEIKARLSLDPYVYACCKSIGGRGLWVLFKIDHTRHKESFEGLLHYLLINYGLSTEGKVVDKSTSNVNRFRFIPHDAELLVNPDSRIFREYVKKAEAKKWEPKERFIDTERDLEYVLQQIDERRLEFTDSSGDWVRAGFALASKYDLAGLEYFQRISQYRHDYDPEETQARYLYFCRIHKGSVSIGTFYYICKQHGLSIISPKTVSIVSVAQMHQKQGATRESTTDSIVQMMQTDRAETKEIVDQSFEAKGQIDTEEALVDRITAFLKMSFDYRFNEVTQRHESETGRGITDADIKTMWVRTMKIVDEKIQFNYFQNIVESNTIFPSFNPFHSFFKKYEHLKPTGVIRKFISAIETDTGFDEGNFYPEYAQYFLRKFIIGIVANVFERYPSGIVPVLTGPILKGKSRIFTDLLPAELDDYFYTTTWEAGRDEERRMCMNLISYNDELKGKDTGTAEHFRKVATDPYYMVRLMHGRHDIRMKRIASMCASSNSPAVIPDPEFNRRIIPVNVLSVDFDLINSVDRIELFMEAYHAYRAGESYQITAEDVPVLQGNTDAFQNKTHERQLIEQHFSIGEKGDRAALFLTATDIHSKITEISGIRNLRLNPVGAALKAIGHIRTHNWQPNEKGTKVSVPGYWIIQNDKSV